MIRLKNFQHTDHKKTKYTDLNSTIQKTLGIIFTVLELYPRSMYIWLDMNEAIEAIDQFICTYISD